jgi:hypothetical protein
MNCVDLQNSLAEIEDGTSAEQLLHLKSCPECAALVEDLNLISAAARELRAVNEPSPRVWNSIETALRQEGRIRAQWRSRSLIPSFGNSWTWTRWMAPVAAILLIAVGLFVRQHSSTRELAVIGKPAAPEVASDAAIAGLNDDDLLLEISDQAPALRAQYEDNLRRVNEFIADARTDVASNPNDEDARRSLLEAYQQKAMLFELALDRSLQ